MAIDGVITQTAAHKVYAKLIVKPDGKTDKVIAVDEHGNAIAGPLMTLDRVVLSATANAP